MVSAGHISAAVLTEQGATQGNQNSSRSDGTWKRDNMKNEEAIEKHEKDVQV